MSIRRPTRTSSSHLLVPHCLCQLARRRCGRAIRSLTMSVSLTPLHIVVIGGGIGGLCLAQGLKVAGVSVAVYERNPVDSWPEGYRIHINPVGSQALHVCLSPVLWDAFVATAGKPPAGFGVLTEQL